MTPCLLLPPSFDSPITNIHHSQKENHIGPNVSSKLQLRDPHFHIKTPDTKPSTIIIARYTVYRNNSSTFIEGVREVMPIDYPKSSLFWPPNHGGPP